MNQSNAIDSAIELVKSISAEYDNNADSRVVYNARYH